MNQTLLWTVALLLIPALVVIIDVWGGVRARRYIARHGSPRRRTVARQGFPPVEDFEVLVPIWGSAKYLVNVPYLAAYSRRVVLCTTTSESPEFVAALTEIARENDFRIFFGDAGSPSRTHADGSVRSTSGTIRDRLVRDAHQILTAKYVVCIDADTTTTRPLDELVGQVAAEGFDLVSVRVVPANTDCWLGRLQAHEYRMAMRLRQIMPWLVSGACHAGLRTSHRAIMERHTLFFQGNDVELGLIAHGLGLRVGHVQFDVPTVVPDTIRGWWRQRIAWAGGEFRLFVVNPHIALRHPFLWTYGLLVTILSTPLRWNAVTHPGWAVLSTVALYLVIMTFIHRGNWDRWLILLPVYTVTSGLILPPLGAITYMQMALKHRNGGLIRIGHRRACTVQSDHNARSFAIPA